VTQLESLMRRRLRRQKPGRKAKLPQIAGDLFAETDRSTQSGNMQGVTAIPECLQPRGRRSHSNVLANRLGATLSCAVGLL
jgi:hypothetical protein